MVLHVACVEAFGRLKESRVVTLVACMEQVMGPKWERRGGPAGATEPALCAAVVSFVVTGHRCSAVGDVGGTALLCQPQGMGLRQGP